MADEPEQTQEAPGGAANVEEAKGDRSAAAPAAPKPSLIPTIVIGLAVMIVTPAVSFLVVSNMMPSSLEKEGKPAQPGEQELFLLGEIRVNILGTKATRFVVMKPHFLLSDASLQGALEKMKPMLADRVSTVISKRTLDQLEGPDARASLRRDIMNEVNALIRDRMQGAVVDVYLVDYLIQ